MTEQRFLGELPRKQTKTRAKEKKKAKKKKKSHLCRIQKPLTLRTGPPELCAGSDAHTSGPGRGRKGGAPTGQGRSPGKRTHGLLLSPLRYLLLPWFCFVLTILCGLYYPLNVNFLSLSFFFVNNHPPYIGYSLSYTFLYWFPLF